MHACLLAPLNPPQGCGIVVYATPAEAQAAIQRLHGSNLWPHAREPLLVQPRLPEHQKPPKKPKPPGASFLPPGAHRLLVPMPQMQMGVYGLPDGMQGLSVSSQPPYVTGMSVQQQYPGSFMGLQYPAAFLPGQVTYSGNTMTAVPLQPVQQHQQQHQQQLVMGGGMLGAPVQLQMSLAPVAGAVAVSHPAAAGSSLQGGPQQPQQQYQQQMLMPQMQGQAGAGVVNMQMGGTMQPVAMGAVQMVPVAGPSASPSAQVGAAHHQCHSIPFPAPARLQQPPVGAGQPSVQPHMCTAWCGTTCTCHAWHMGTPPHRSRSMMPAGRLAPHLSLLPSVRHRWLY
jgi:hypothetical protein